MIRNKILQKRILLAEDDQSISEVVSLILQEHYKVTVPTNFEKLKSLLTLETYDLILLDMMLWGHNGLDICKMLKADKQRKHTKVIILSASSEARKLAHISGADDIIEKPFDIDQLLIKIRHNLQ